MRAFRLVRGCEEGEGGNWRWSPWLLPASLLAMVIIFFWRLALTNLIIGRGDIFFYFYPYRDYASAAARAGRVPLWNPYLFMGAPFLANSQAGFFYPLNLLLAWLPVTGMVNASILLHAALAATGAFLWGRRSLGLGEASAWLTGLLYGLGGYFTAQIEHLNQIQVLAWLPWLLWLYPWRRPADHRSGPGAPGWLRKTVALALVITAQILAGHTQSVFIGLVGLIAFAMLPLLWDRSVELRRWRQVVRPAAVLAGATLLGAALAAVQLLPTLELSRLSIRDAGLPYREAVSFSLLPELVGRALLPSWGPPLFAEYVAHLGVVALGLALAGVAAVGQGSTAFLLRGGTRAQRLGRNGALTLACLGIFFALGGFNPIYIVLVRFVPGFGLFRAPARWLVLYALGSAGLAGVGLDHLLALRRMRNQPGARASFLRGRAALLRILLLGAGTLTLLVLMGQQFGGRADPDLVPPLGAWSVAGWLWWALIFVAVLALSLWAGGAPSPTALRTLLLITAVAELAGASLFLSFNRATAPGALKDLRPSVAHLIGESNETKHPPPARFLSISDVLFDPGDKTEIEIELRPQLLPDAVYDYVIATKQKEVLIPNLPLYYRLPAMDGYDGGVLPLRRYVTLQRLYMPEGRVAVDGRLRENLRSVPDGRWLSLFNVRFVVTDKVGDAWFDDVFYDLQMGATLGSGERVTVADIPVAEATALGIVYRAEDAGDGAQLAEVALTFSDGRRVVLPLLAGTTEEGDRATRVGWSRPAGLSAIALQGTWAAGEVSIRGLSLIDERTGVFWPLVISDRGRFRLVHSGDVKIYENLDVLPRAFFVERATVVPNDAAALEVMGNPDFAPASEVVLMSPDGETPPAAAVGATASQTQILHYEPERVVIAVSAPRDGWLLLTDAWYPGWKASVDGMPVPVARADVLFRAVAVPAGKHRVELVYRPDSFRVGATLSAVTLCVILVGAGWWAWRRNASLRAGTR